jgi:hypothetical protein
VTDVLGQVEPGEVQLPPGPWIPNVDQVSDSAGCLLGVAGAALDSYGLAQRFTRRVFSHGTVPLQLSDTKKGQLLVSLKNIELGRAGAKQFQTDEGALGKYAFIVAEFGVELWIPWPTLTGGIAPKTATDPALMEAAFDLNRALFVVFAALRALSLGGVKTNPPLCPIVQDHVLVGPATPVGPDGSFAGYAISVECQY